MFVTHLYTPWYSPHLLPAGRRGLSERGRGRGGGGGPRRAAARAGDAGGGARGARGARGTGMGNCFGGAGAPPGGPPEGGSAPPAVGELPEEMRDSFGVLRAAELGSERAASGYGGSHLGAVGEGPSGAAALGLGNEYRPSVGGLTFGAEQRAPSRPRARGEPEDSSGYGSLRAGVLLAGHGTERGGMEQGEFVPNLTDEETKIRSPRGLSPRRRSGGLQELDSPTGCDGGQLTSQHPFADAIRSYKESHESCGRRRLRRWPWQRAAGGSDGGMWVHYLNELGVPDDNPGRRHLQNVFTSNMFLSKVDALMLTLDSNGTGHVEEHEFRFFLDGLQGRMRPFLRAVRPSARPEPSADLEFVLSEKFKAAVCQAVQDELFTWRQFVHPWALPRVTFRELLQLTLAAAVRLAVDAAASGNFGAGMASGLSPIAIDFSLLMASPVEGPGSPAHNLFCHTVFDLHVLCPPQTADLVDGTIDESSREFSLSRSSS